MTGTVEPFVDPKSPSGHICVPRSFLEQRLEGKPNKILRAHFIAESVGNNPKLYWFEDAPAVRLELGMEPKP